MDVTTLQAELAKDEEGVVVPIYDKGGEPYTAADGTPTTITVLGSDSRPYRAAVEANQKRLLKQRRPSMVPGDLTRNRIEAAAAAIVAWHGFESDGAEWPCTSDHVKELLQTPHILEQVEAGIASHADFFKNSSAS